MVSEKGLESRLVGSPADSMSNARLAAEGLKQRLMRYKPAELDSKPVSTGLELTVALYVPINYANRELIDKNTHYGVLCGVPYFLNAIVPNGHWSMIRGSFDDTLAEYGIKSGALGCFDGKVGVTPNGRRIAVPLRINIGAVPEEDVRNTALAIRKGDRVLVQAYHQYGN